MLDQAKWIWCNASPAPDEYGEFSDSFVFTGEKVTLRISADSNYEVYLNGTLATFGQYADFPYDKVFDTVDLTPFCQRGENALFVRVWYMGMDDSSTYYPGHAGLLYEVVQNEAVLCFSSEKTLARMSKMYRNHRQKRLTKQMGYGYAADLPDDAHREGFVPATVVEQTLPLRERPCKKLVLRPFLQAKECKRLSATDVIFDLGKETVGFLSFAITAPCAQEITVSYGEHLADGCVRQKIGSRDFSADFGLQKGKNTFANFMRRFGCRYLEIHSESPLNVENIGLVPVEYPLTEQPHPALSEREERLYRMCVETLRLCMHEHYEDCPWREQALYTMDSRNQMLCGYYVFGEKQFARASLELISKDDRYDGMLSICYPVCWDFIIPSFSLHYFTECREYLDHTGDKAFSEQVYPKLESILNAFLSRMENDLVSEPEGKQYWNFYEWRPGLEGRTDEPVHLHLVLNTLLSLALQNMAHIADALGKPHTYLQTAARINEAVRRVFFDGSVFFDRPRHSSYSQLGNALAILCGAATDKKALCEKLLHDRDMVPVSLSMAGFVYDALLHADKTAYAQTVLDRIMEIYAPMLDSDSTTLWETEVGESDFAAAGSLCHGWSALPAYYFHLLKG